MRLVMAVIGVLAIVVAIAAGVFFFGGFYNVTASKEDPSIVSWALLQIRTASINHYATDVQPSNINDAESIKAGARSFDVLGCSNCHGAPGVQWAKFSEGLHPAPPDLKDVVDQFTPSQLFWIVKNGINMTGMPSFALAGAKDEDMWTIVSFLKKLPTVSEADYKSWTAPAPGVEPSGGLQGK